MTVSCMELLPMEPNSRAVCWGRGVGHPHSGADGQSQDSSNSQKGYGGSCGVLWGQKDTLIPVWSRTVGDRVCLLEEVKANLSFEGQVPISSGGS